MLSSNLSLDIRSSLSSSGFEIKFLICSCHLYYACHISTHIILFYLITLIIFPEKYKTRSFSLCSFLQNEKFIEQNFLYPTKKDTNVSLRRLRRFCFQRCGAVQAARNFYRRFGVICRICNLVQYFFYSVIDSNNFLQNICDKLWDHTMSHPRRQNSACNEFLKHRQER